MDCATGNGQAAVLLVDYFQQIFATDTSEKQLSYAKQIPNIFYSIGTADKTVFNDNTFDLITVAQAYHWFKFDEFYKETIRVGKHNAVIAIWGYGLIQTDDEKLNKLVQHFYVDVVGKYWDAERRYVDEKYQTIPFKFNELPHKDFSINVQWDTEDLLGYLNTWSSVQHFIKANNHNPVDEFAKQLEANGHIAVKTSFSFPLFLRIGRIEK